MIVDLCRPTALVVYGSEVLECSTIRSSGASRSPRIQARHADGRSRGRQHEQTREADSSQRRITSSPPLRHTAAIHFGKQACISPASPITTRDHRQSRSASRKLQTLVEQKAGTGHWYPSGRGSLTLAIGIYQTPGQAKEVPTTEGHDSLLKTGAHVVPADPEPQRDARHELVPPHRGAAGRRHPPGTTTCTRRPVSHRVRRR